MSGATQQGPLGNGSFQQQALTFIIALGKGTFGQTGQNTATLAGLRAQVTIRKSGAPSMDVAEARIYGVQPEVMNAVSDLGIPAPLLRIGNTLTIQAGNPVTGMATIYSGYLKYAYQDFNEMPESCLQWVGYGGAPGSIVPTPAISFPGAADVATIMSGIATTAGWKFENGGVQVQLSNPYFAGTALQQAQKCARAAGINMYLDTTTSPNTLAIWPKNGTRGGAVPLISAESGMIGYPSWYNNGMVFETVFNPNIAVGGQIQMQSSLGTGVVYSNPAAPRPQDVIAGGPNGLWYVNGPIVHNLTSQIPDGPWISEVHCSRVLAGTA